MIEGQFAAVIEGERLELTCSESVSLNAAGKQEHSNIPLNCPLAFSSSAVLRVPLLYVTHLEGVTGEGVGEATAEETMRPASAMVGSMVKLNMLADVRCEEGK